jgi:acyl carrier protein
MNINEIFDIIAKTIKEINPDANITEKTALIADSVLDSLEFMNYITIIEEKFQISISDADIENQRLGIIENMINYILSR